MKDILESEIILRDMEDIYGRDIGWEPLKGKTMLVTGASGMLASYLVYYLIYLNEKHHYGIRILAQVRNREKAGRVFGIYLKKEYFRVVEEDICRPVSVPEKADYIIHAASLASPKYYEAMPLEVSLPNAIGTYYLLDYAARVGCKGFLYFSSGDVYGKLEAGMDVTEDTFGGLDPLAAHSCYGESKRMGETWCGSFAREKDVPAKIARIAHTYGPTMDIEGDPRVFADFMRNVFKGEDIVMHSDGRARRPFCYAADAAAAFLIILLYGNSGEAYNVCNEDEFLSVAQLAGQLAALREDLRLKVVRQGRKSGEDYLENKINKSNKTVSGKLKRLGWEAHYTVRQGFYNTLEYLRWERGQAE